MLQTFAVFALGIIVGALVWRTWLQPAPAAERDLTSARRGTGSHRLPSMDRTQDALLAAFRTEEIHDPADALREDQRILADALRDVAKRTGAIAAILWELEEESGGVAVPVASSADDARSSITPAVLPVLGPKDRERVEYTARHKMPSVDRTPEGPQLAIAALDVSGKPGALTLHYTSSDQPDLVALKGSIVEHAKALQSLYGLVRTRADVSRQNFRLRGLIRTAGTLQATRDPLELEHLLVIDSLTVAGADWTVLVRWDEATRTGSVRKGSPEALMLGLDFASLVIPADSIAGVTCAEGRPQVFSDARPVTRAESVFGTGHPLEGVGSLIAVPLRRGEQDRPLGALVCGHRDVAALRAMEARNLKNLAVIAAGALETAWEVEDARRNARTDPLTGLANRRGFDERFDVVIQETDRYGGSAALILVDLDRFKRVNDTYGHEAGDQVLIAVSAALAEGRRTVDTTARLGGEELAVLLPQTDLAGAREVAERMRKRIEALTVRTAIEIRVTASFGVAEYAARSGQAERVVERADQALYAAKRNGRNRVELGAAT